MIKLLYPLFLLRSRFPLKLIYAHFKVYAWILKNIVGYRKAVVRDNLAKCFPEKSPEELVQIENDYYRFLARLGAEIVKNLTMKPEQLKENVRVKNPEVLQQLFEEKDLVFLMVGHYGNWEYISSSLNLQMPQQPYVLYKPFRNEDSQWFIDKERLRHGTKVIPFKSAYKEIQQLEGKNLIEFISDQSPLRNNAIWKQFFNRETPVFKGTEKIASRLDAAIVYGHITVGELGKYELEYIPIEEKSDTTNWPVTGKVVELLEANIREAPQYWLWSHRRWKYGPNA